MAVIQLAKPLEHSFTPDADPADVETVIEVLDRLEEMPVDEEDSMQAFLDAWNETKCWIWDRVSKARVASSAHTDDDEAQQTWAKIISTVLPEVSRRQDRLGRKLLEAPHVETLEDGPYAAFLRQLRVEVELFREENVALEQREQELTNQYQQISGSWSVDFDGESRTLSQMRRYAASSDRDVRREAYLAIRETVGETRNQIEDNFNQLRELRQQIAANAGFDDYREYIFKEKLRDYGPDECYAFAELVEEEVVPLVEEIAEDTRKRLGVDTFRPWDAAADPDGGEPLEPFEKTDELKSGVERMMRRLDPGLGERFAQIRQNMDLESRANKSQGGFMTWYAWDKRPFIFANAAGNHSDVVTLLHEAGHAFHGLLADEAKSRPMANVYSPMEFNEVASMAMELLNYDTLDEFYDADDRERAIKQHLRRIPRLFCGVARGDMFQHWLYTNPDHSDAERRAKYVELEHRYQGHYDYSGIDEEMLADGYHLVLHFFIVPFYYIEYGFAQFGALQVAMNAEKDLAGAMADYKRALSFGPQKDVKSLYSEAGIEFVPTRERVRAAMNWIRERLFE